MRRLMRTFLPTLVCLVTLAPLGAAAAGPERAVPDGRYYGQAGGFAVTNDGGVRFWDAFKAYGGVDGVGYPASRRFVHGGFVTQVMQKAVFQWRADTGQVLFVNVFDDLAGAGRDEWLLGVRSTPRPLSPGFDGSRQWSAIVAARQALLDTRPAIRARYFSTPDPILRYGLPTSRIEDMGNHYAIRLQRAVIQEWKVDVPWARRGETTVANGGDIMKEAGMIPGDATTPEDAIDAPKLGPRLEPDARVTADVAVLRRAAGASAGDVARVFRNATVQLSGPPSDGWVRVRLWNALEGWLPTTALTSDGYPTEDPRAGGGYRRAIPGVPEPSTPLPVDAPAFIAGGAQGRVVGYRTEASRTTFEVQLAEGRSWLPASAVTIKSRDPYLLNPSAASGKGMWATYDLLDRASPEAIIATARANGLSHIYLQVGRTNLGYYGADGLRRLRAAAAGTGVTIVAWVYPFLRDTTADVNMTMQAARDADALAADVEENMGAEEVGAYGQLVRAMVGDDYPLIVATYPPQMAHGRSYPFAAVARSFNVIAPMDYYHRPGRVYSPDEAASYIARSVTEIRQRVGVPVHVAPIGQAYGMSWPNETGPTNPNADETRAMLRSARESGAVGISFFEWAHATSAQWREIGSFAWP